MKTLRLPACACPFPYGFGPRFHVRLLCCSCSPKRSRCLRRSFIGPGAFGQPVSPVPAYCARGRVRDLSGCLTFHPMPLPCSKTPAEPTSPRLVAVLPMLPPAQEHRRPRRVEISRLTTRLQHLPPTLHDQRRRCPCKAGFRLAGCAFAGSELNPLDRVERFRNYILPPLQAFA